MKIEFQSKCDVGAYRSNNEDAVRFGQSKDGSLVWMVIADGMGGHLAGEVASDILVTHVELAINALTSFAEIDWRCWIEIELNRANNKIFSSSQSHNDQKGMGTTAVMVILYQQKCYIGWVGDSRGYFYQAEKGEVTQVTKDHTMVQALLDKGAISEQEAADSNSKNMLSKAIGIKYGQDVDSKNFDIKENDIVFISTDGLHDSLSSEEFNTFFTKIADGLNIEQEIVNQSIDNGSKDNITFASAVIKNLN